MVLFSACPPELMPSFPRYRNMKRKSAAAALPAPAAAAVPDARCQLLLQFGNSSTVYLYFIYGVRKQNGTPVLVI